ncbi:hypothetical protein PVOR_21264 [Paenibacillus vortex V453]|uniref:Uncharacterized protein n=1 Tax=Paenibacillus vortex V453 TaxID=715225 RepID=A0A2R9SR75_9BACL|nr:hypothetical protein [Paenibacillus vortex]EFU39858.1 hypothetical protein PVOR_21264 [Paenibacillus vortex V453]
MNQPSHGTTNQFVKLYKQETWLMLAGLIGFLLAGFCGIWVLLNGGPVAPDGDVSKAISFTAALGIFTISTAAILPVSGLRPRSKSIFRCCYIFLVLFSYFAETVQNFRGVNPRFVQNGSAFDVVIAISFSAVALLLLILYLIFGLQYFRKQAMKAHPELVLGIRYAMIAVLISFAAGIWISINAGRFTGIGGNIIWLHGLGFHALQAIPFVAWLSLRKSFNPAAKPILIHMSGIAYLLGLVAIGWQTLLGYSIAEWSLLPILAGSCFLIAFTPVIWLLRQTNASASALLSSHARNI